MRSKAWLAVRVSLPLARLPRTASSAQRSRRLRSTRAAAPVLLAHAIVTENINILSMGPKLRHTTVRRHSCLTIIEQGEACDLARGNARQAKDCRAQVLIHSNTHKPRLRNSERYKSMRILSITTARNANVSSWTRVQMSTEVAVVLPELRIQCFQALRWKQSL